MNEVKFNLETLKVKLESLGRNVDDYEKENKVLIKMMKSQGQIRIVWKGLRK